jgi:hypothetical protein
MVLLTSPTPRSPGSASWWPLTSPPHSDPLRRGHRAVPPMRGECPVKGRGASGASSWLRRVVGCSDSPSEGERCLPHFVRLSALTLPSPMPRWQSVHDVALGRS